MSNCRRKWIIKADISLTQGPPGPEGPPGPGSDIELPITTDDVIYETTDQTLTEIIDQLLYTPLTINSFIAAVSTYEKGQTLTSVSLSWTFNKAVQSQTITGTNVVPPSLTVGERTKIVSLNNITTDTVITLTADDVTGDGNLPKTRTTTLTFLNKVYWGKAAIGTVNSAFILALSNSELRANRFKTFSISTGASEYIWYATPSAYGPATFKTNGFNGGFQFHSTISFTNASGHTENYDVYRSENHNLGLTAVEVL